MPRARVLLMMTALTTLPPIAAGQAVPTFTVSKSALADVHQETLQAVYPDVRQAVEVFPGTYVSPLGQAVVTRVEALMGRVDEADRNALIASRARAGFDRTLIRWLANPSGRTVAIAVRYFREPLWKLELEMTDDYGRADPVDPARYEFIGIATCTLAETRVWTCAEEPLAAVAGRHNVAVPQDRAERLAAAEKLVEMVLAGK